MTPLVGLKFAVKKKEEREKKYLLYSVVVFVHFFQQ